MITIFFPDQEVIQTQEQSITELLKAVREQSDQLNHQRLKIKILEEKVNVSECRNIIRRGESAVFSKYTHFVPH